jgi:beta-glucosidase
VNAGIDMFMIPFKAEWQPFFDHLKKQVESGEVPMARIDDAVSRILRVKLRAGLFDRKNPVARSAGGAVAQPGAPEHRAVAREAVRKSLVLLKNNHRLLPLDRSKRILVTGRGADSIALQSGGWSVTWQGTDNTNRDYTNATSILGGLRAAGKNVTYDPKGDHLDRNAYDVAIAVIGEKPYAEYKGDIKGGLTLEHAWNYPEDLALLRKLKNARIPVVTVLLSGRPLCVNRELNCSDAFIAAWLPGSEGAGIADVLFRPADGKSGYDFSGRLSFSLPKRPCQTAVNKGDQPYDPLFPVGYGLCYAGADTVIDSVPEYSNDTYGCTGLTPPSGLVDSVLRLYNGTFVAADVGGWMGGPDNWGGRQGNPDANIPTLNVTMTADRSGKERSALHFNFSGPAYWCIGGKERDLTGYFINGYSLAFDVCVTKKPLASVSAVIVCNYPCQDEVDITGILNGCAIGKWQTVRLPLRNFMAADFRKITAPFQIFSTGAAEFSIADIRLEK